MYTQDLKDGRYFIFTCPKAASAFADLFGVGRVTKLSEKEFEIKF